MLMLVIISWTARIRQWAVLKPLIIRPPDSDDSDVNDNFDDDNNDLHVQEGLESTDVIVHKGEVLVLNR